MTRGLVARWLLCMLLSVHQTATAGIFEQYRAAFEREGIQPCDACLLKDVHFRELGVLPEHRHEVAQQLEDRRINATHPPWKPRTCDHARIRDWVIASGGFIHENTTVNGRTLTTTGTIGAGNAVFTIPDSLCIKPTPRLLEQAHDDSTEWVMSAIAHRLLNETAKASSVYGPFLDCLPATCQNLICAPYTLLARIAKTVATSAHTYRQAFLEHRRLIYGLGAGGEGPGDGHDATVPSEEAWLIAVSVAMSRSWAHGMVPFADMMDHSPDVSDPTFADGEFGLEWTLTANRQQPLLQAGLPILNNYNGGPSAHTNAVNLLQYGFVSDSFKHMHEGMVVGRPAATRAHWDAVQKAVEMLNHGRCPMLHMEPTNQWGEVEAPGGRGQYTQSFEVRVCGRVYHGCPCSVSCSEYS
jgi:hypothetical protein